MVSNKLIYCSSIFVILFCCSLVSSFQSNAKPAFTSTATTTTTTTRLLVENDLNKTVSSMFCTAALITSCVLTANPLMSSADEIGVSVDAPTLITGEAVEICVKRGPLGKCEKTEMRTADNDNDKASKYMKMTKTTTDPVDVADYNSPLIIKLKEQTEANREKNERIVRQKTLQNDLGASFGPLDRQVVILNTDGDTYTLLQNPQAMRLKKAGFIEGKKFIKQPTKEEIDASLEPSPDEGLTGLVKSFLGSSDDSEGGSDVGSGGE